MHLKQSDYLPEDLLEVSSKDLHTILPEPTLIHLSGKHTAPLFVSVLLHGNEPTGFMAIQLLLKKYKDRQLPRSLSLFVGNVTAANHNLRSLDNQPDYNRIWPGTELPDCAETEMAKEIVALMKKRNVFASVDIHNNTGLNPHYACINSLDNQFLQLASLFGRLIVYFIRPKGVQSSAFAQICPAVTLECGRPGQQHGVEHAFEYLNSCLHLTELPQHQILPRDIDLFHTVAQVKINDQVNFSFNRADADLLLSVDIEHMNFTEIFPGTVFGLSKNNATMPLIARDEHGNIVTNDFFSVQNSELQINRPTMPSMLTLDERVIKQDCLCYLMERIHL
ncbi:MAG: M14 family metallopeptidase [Methylococcales bacterium]|nr:M14 family metallopeptidase [Methylococcales bacterium]